MVKAEDKSVECMNCGQMLVLSAYNTTVCPACGIVYHELERTLLEGGRALKDWCDRLEAEGKNPEDFIDKLAGLMRLLRLLELSGQKVVSIQQWRQLRELFQDESDPPSEIHESTS